ncbi:MAG: HAD family hydrolase [Chloroflexota bacterium]
MRHIRGLLFDFDGLVLETEAPAFQSWHEVYEVHGGLLSLESWARVLGGTGREIDHIAELERIAGFKLDGETIYRGRLERKQALCDKQEILPGVMDYITEGIERGFKLAIVSSSPHEWVDRYLTRLGLMNDFDTVVCGEDGARAKPYPDLYERALADLGLGADEAIAFEDSPNGITAAQAAGIFCVAVPNAVSARFSTEHADLKLGSLADMRLGELVRRADLGHSG